VAYEDFLQEKKILDDVVRIIHDEDQRYTKMHSHSSLLWMIDGVHAWYLWDFTQTLLNMSLHAQEYLMQEIRFLQITCYYYAFLLKIPWHFIGSYVFQIWQHLLFVSYYSKLIQGDSCAQSSECLLPLKTDLTGSYRQLRELIHNRKVVYWPEFYN